MWLWALFLVELEEQWVAAGPKFSLDSKFTNLVDETLNFISLLSHPIDMYVCMHRCTMSIVCQYIWCILVFPDIQTC